MHGLFPFYSIGHFLNQPSNPTEFEIMRFDRMDEPEVDDVHKHSFYEILWTEAGSSKQTIDYTEYEVHPNSLFFISPNQVHQFEEWRRLTGGTILFTENFYLLRHQDKDSLFELSFLDNVYANPCIQLSENDFAEIKRTIDWMQMEHSRPDRNPLILQSLLHILLSQVQRCLETETAQRMPRKYVVLFKQFKRLLDTHFMHNHSASFYAEALHITTHHLNLVCKEVTGRTAGGVIRARSILEARRLLTFSDKTVSEIAFDLHYVDSSHLARVFKAETQQTPMAFKQEMSEKYRIR